MVSDGQNVLCILVNTNVKINGGAIIFHLLGRNGIEFIDLPHFQVESEILNFKS